MGVGTDATVDTGSPLSGQPPVTPWTSWSQVRSPVCAVSDPDSAQPCVEAPGGDGQGEVWGLRRERDREGQGGAEKTETGRHRERKIRDPEPDREHRVLREALVRSQLRTSWDPSPLLPLSRTAPCHTLPLSAAGSHSVLRRDRDPAVSIMDPVGHLPSGQGGGS